MTTAAAGHTKDSDSQRNLFSRHADQPLFSFGVITDIQYADIPNGHSFWGTPRYYRHSFQALHEAVSFWNKQGGLSFIVQFGDIVDGRCPKEQSPAAVKKVISEFDAFQGGPVYHMLGNHCFYNLPRDELNEMLKIPACENGSSYYAFNPCPGFRFVVLDGYDISVLGWPESHPRAQAAAKILEEKNPNEDKNSPAGLAELDQRYVMFNGGVGKEQLEWLDRMLQEATDSQQKVIIGCHVPLYGATTFSDTLLWNSEEVLGIIHKYQCVVACLVGHKHEGGYAVDSHGIHHRVLEAVLECPPGHNAFGHVDVYHDRISLVGHGRMLSAEMRFPTC